MGEARTRRRKTIAQPYPGLRPFLRGENLIFFGREGQTDELIGRLRQNHFLAVLGSSGSGKSSLVRAGLLPALESGLMAGARPHWKMAVIRPGERPIRYLAAALADLVAHPDDPGYQVIPASTMLETMLQASSFGLQEAALGPVLQDHENLLVVVDQFEEIFRFNEDDRDSDRLNEARAFVRLILQASTDPKLPIYVVITMRSDFLGECPRFSDLPEAINAGQYLVPRLSRAQLREAITGPAAVFKEQVAPDLVIRLLNDIGDNPDQLPILQHALMRTWTHHETGKEVGVLDYEAIGGLGNALNQHAEEIYAELRDRDLTEVTEALFKCLTEMEVEGKGIRRPSRLMEVCAAAGVNEDQVKQVVEAFRAPGRSFLMPPAEVPLTADTILDISHESFMRLWVRLGDWVREEFRSAEEYLRLSKAATDHAAGKVNLWRQPELGIALKWYQTTDPTEAWAARYDSNFTAAIDFLNDSLTAWKKEEEEKAAVALLQRKSEERKKTVRRLSLLLLLLGGMLSISVIALIYAWQQSKYAHEKELEANLKADTLQVAVQRIQGLLAEAKQNENSIRKLKEETDTLNYLLQAKIITIEDQRKILDSQFRTASTQRDSLQDVKNRLDKTNKDLEKARKRADEYADLQENLRITADSLRGGAERRSQLLDALQKAAQSTEVADPHTAALLAIDAMNQYAKNGGDPDDPKIYGPLQAVLERFKPQIRTTFPATPLVMNHDSKTGHAMVVAMTGKVHELFWENGRFHFPEKATLGTSNGRFICHGHQRQTILTADLSHRLRVFKATGGRLESTLLGHQHPITGAVELPDKTVVSCDLGGNLYSWRPQVNPSAPYALLRGEGAFHALALSPNGSNLVAGGSRELVILKADRMEQQLRHKVPAAVTALAFHPNGSILAFGLENGVVGYYDFRMDSVLAYPVHAAKVSCISFSPDGQYLASGSYDQTLRLWRISRLESPMMLRGHQSWVVGLGFTGDGKLLYSASKDKTLRQWHLTSAGVATALGDEYVDRNEFTDQEQQQYHLQDKRVEGVKGK